MHITSKGQVTIPKEFRDLCGLQPHSEAEFALEDGKLVIRPAQPIDRGSYIVEHFRGQGDIMLSTDEIMALTRGED